MGAGVVAKMTPLEQVVPVSALLGYLNFSNGRPDPRWQKQVNEAYTWFVQQGEPQPWQALQDFLRTRLEQLRGSSSAFREVHQAEEVLATVQAVLPAYRRHHGNLLAHLADAELFLPFFLVRVYEAVLQQRANDNQTRSADAVNAVLHRLNDFVGYRPIAILESRPQGEPYEHERHRPIPLYLRGAGVSWGRYQEMVARAQEILRETSPDLLNEAQLDLDLLDEVAVDARAYDHSHPVNRRPNYVFGEWDPHHLDNQGRFRRYVVRHILLDGLLDRVMQAGAGTLEERLVEAAAVLAGTILMAMGITGNSPTSHDSSVSLSTLLPRIARYRDLFYDQLLPRLPARHAERLREEQAQTRQPFGSARQHLNAFLGRHRALQMQQRHLSILYATMGYPEASRQEAQKIPSVSGRMLGSILGEMTSAGHEAQQGRLNEAAQRLPVAESLLREGIACGGFADPWNILAFQGLFPLSPAREDSIRDPRLDELTQVMEGLFNLYARLIGDGAAQGNTDLINPLLADQQRLASWWDRFATSTVSDIRRVHGGESATAIDQLASALTRWHERGETPADLAFWRGQLDHFRSPRAFALVVETLLRKRDFRAALALLTSWVAQADQVPLEDGPASYHALALRWMLALTRPEENAEPKLELETNQRRDLIIKFFDYLEANAEDYWQVPTLQVPGPEDEDENGDDLFDAAYESVTYQDTTDDAQESAVDEGPLNREFNLEPEAESLEKRLRFLSTLARLWQVAGRYLAALPASASGEDAPNVTVLTGWLTTARQRLHQLLTLLDGVHEFALPEPSGDYDSLIEYDRHRAIKERLLFTTLSACLDVSLAVGGLRGPLLALAGSAVTDSGTHDAPPWEPLAIQIEQALFRGDQASVRALLEPFVEQFQAEPLLFPPLSEGGQPRMILRVRLAQTVLRALLANLPRLGLLRETFELLRTARTMEQTHPPRGRGVTEFNNFFQSAFQAVVENVVEAASTWEPEQAEDVRLVEMLERLTAPFLGLWIDHSRTLQLSVLETLNGDPEWRRLQEFVQRYGGELFHVRFMTLSNLRSILHRGVGAWLDYLKANPDPLHPIRLLDELDRRVRRADAIRYLELVLNAVVENYEEFKDYNTTTTQSDYGENLYVLLELLRLKAAYERHAWHFRPLLLAHDVLARHGRGTAAVQWERSLTQLTRDLARQHLEQLARVEQTRGVRLHTISDRLHERFTKPLALDRLCALIEPAMREASTHQEIPVPSAFERLQQEIQAYTTTPTGVGIDLPFWLRRMEMEVNRVQASHTTVAVLAEHLFRVPRRSLPYDDLQDQLRQWDRPSLPL